MTFRLTEFSSVSITQVVDVRTPKARYKRSRVEGNEAPYWKIELTTVPLEYAEAMAAAAYLNSLKSSLTIFPFPNPLPELTSGVSFTNYSPNSEDSNQLSIEGVIPNLQNAVRAGDFVQCSNHQKVYQVIDDDNFDGSSQLIANITPELQATTTNGEVIKYGEDVAFQCCLDDYIPIDVIASKGKFVVFDITLLEQG
ncbi:hypothetical protein [Paraglaciecola sp.]|uniref:hypothetical protein n=1 Tax=Paraglaciecola sp. TaxID=1920173 RepID=UPI003EF976B7